MPPPPVTLTFILLTLKVVSESPVTWATYVTNFSLPRPFCSRLRPDVRDRQTDVRQHHWLMPPPMGRGIISICFNTCTRIYRICWQTMAGLTDS